MTDYLRWLTGPEEARQLGALVLRGRVLVEVLRFAPQDEEVRRELVRVVGAAAGLTDRIRWTAAGEIAGSLVRCLAARRRGPPPLDVLEPALAQLEVLIFAMVR